MNCIRTVVVAASVALFATGCLHPAAEFEGTYSASGSQNYTLIVNNKSTNHFVETKASLRFVEGISSDLVLDDGSGCLIPFNAIDFETANAIAASTCSTTTQNGMTATVTVISGVARKSGSTVKLTLDANVQVFYNGSTVPGTYTSSLTLSKMTK